MQKLIYVPPNSNEQVILTAAEPFILSSVSGLGGVESDVISSEVVGMDGVFYHGCKKTPRPIPCTVYVKGKNREDMYRQRLRIIGLLRAENDVGTLYYSNDYISVKIGAVPITPPDFNERLKNYNKADLKFWCPQPLWQSLETKTASIAKIDGIGFEMPFQFPITFAHIKNEIVINNLGTSRAPVTITITGTGVNPTITNTANGKTISLLDKTLADGEQLIINTERGDNAGFCVDIREDSARAAVIYEAALSAGFYERERSDHAVSCVEGVNTDGVYRILVECRHRIALTNQLFQDGLAGIQYLFKEFSFALLLTHLYQEHAATLRIKNIFQDKRIVSGNEFFIRFVVFLTADVYNIAVIILFQQSISRRFIGQRCSFKGIGYRPFKGFSLYYRNNLSSLGGLLDVIKKSVTHIFYG